MKKHLTLLKCMVFGFLFAMAMTGTVMAQVAGTGGLTGIVFDPSGAVIAGAKVTLTHTATADVRTAETTTAGTYRFVALPVGSYSMKVEMSGFKTASVANIVITVGAVYSQDVHLDLGTTSEVVEVTAGAELVQTTQSSLSTLVDRQIWENMPLEVRSQNVFINLAPGVVPDAQAGSTRGAAVNGARGGTGNYLVEGTDNYEQGQGGRGQLGADPGGASTSISPDAIAEYRIITNSFDAQYGKAGGFITDTVLRSGTNKWHGSLFEYNRVQALAANDFFSNSQGIKDSLVRNQFGGSIGGPIIKDKTFFYYGMEFHRMRQGATATTVGTTQQFLDFVKTGGLKNWAETDPNGVCMQNLGHTCPGAFAQSATFGPIFSKLLGSQNFPLATSGFSNEGQGFYTGGLTYPVPVYGDVFVSNPYHLNEYRMSAKVDHKISDRDQLSVFFLNQAAQSGDKFGGGQSTLGPEYTNDGRGVNLGVTWNRTISPSVLNSFKVAYLRHRSDFPQAAGTAGIPAIATWYDPLGVGFGMYAGLPQFFTENQFQYQDNLSFVRGKHSIKLGAEYRRTRNGSSFYNDTFGTFYPYGIEDLVTDLAFTDNGDKAIEGKYVNGSAYQASAAVNAANGQLPEVYRGFRANELAAYIQDDWRVTPRLTINMGMRWEYFGPPHNFRPGIDSNFYFGNPITPVKTTSTNPFFPKGDPFYAGVSTGVFQVRDNEIWNKDTNNFGPRLGFAFDLFGDQKVVLRAGSGLMYDRVYNNTFENIRFNPPFFSDNVIGAAANGVPVGAFASPGLYTVPFTSTGAFYSGGLAPVPNPRHMDQNMVTPYYEQFHLGIQWEFAKGYVLETGYVGTMGHKLVSYRDINTFNGRVARGYAGTRSTTRINPNIGADNYRSNAYTSNYHSWQTTVRRAYASGLGFNMNYTWSKALDEISDTFNGRASTTVTDTMNVRTDYGPADFNMKHRFVGTLSYDLPVFRNNNILGGWSMNTIITLQSGVPFSPYSSSSSYDLNKNGLNTDRISFVGSGSAMDSVKDGSPADGYFNTANWKRYVCPSSVNGGLWCNSPLGRGAMTGPGLQNVDFNIVKKFKITEGVSLKVQGNFFNLFNHTNFALPSFNDTSSSFGRSTSAYAARVTQIALRLDF